MAFHTKFRLAVCHLACVVLVEYRLAVWSPGGTKLFDFPDDLFVALAALSLVAFIALIYDVNSNQTANCMDLSRVAYWTLGAVWMPIRVLAFFVR